MVIMVNYIPRFYLFFGGAAMISRIFEAKKQQQQQQQNERKKKTNKKTEQNKNKPRKSFGIKFGWKFLKISFFLIQVRVRGKCIKMTGNK